MLMKYYFIGFLFQTINVFYQNVETAQVYTAGYKNNS